MPKKKKLIVPIAKCHVEGCTEDAVYGFREFIDGNTMTTSGFNLGDCPNWCLKHDAEKRREYANVNGRIVGPF